MKIAISIPDPLFKKIEQFAHTKGMSRSAFFSKAAEGLIAREMQDSLIAQINAACDQVDTSLDPVIQSEQEALLSRNDW